jgi:MFS transporter, DHA1 family, multidrug resistance protein
VIAAGLLWSTMFVYIGGAPFMYMELHHVSPSTFGVLFGVNAAGMIGAAQINARQLRTHTPGTLLRFGAALVSAGGLTLLLAVATGLGGLPLVAIALFVMLSGLGFVGGNASSAALAPFPHAAGSASALMGTVQFAIGASAGAVAAALFDGTGRATGLVISVVALGGAAVAIRARVGER